MNNKNLQYFGLCSNKMTTLGIQMFVHIQQLRVELSSNLLIDNVTPKAFNATYMIQNFNGNMIVLVNPNDDYNPKQPANAKEYTSSNFIIVVYVLIYVVIDLSVTLMFVLIKLVP